MVRGIIAFRQHFYNFKDNYILIGGAACDIHEEVEAQVPRATKDLDVILVVEALSPDFVKEFWNFIRHGNYKSRQRGKNKHEYFRFMNPDDDNYPKQVELFARNIELLNSLVGARNNLATHFISKSCEIFVLSSWQVTGKSQFQTKKAPDKVEGDFVMYHFGFKPIAKEAFSLNHNYKRILAGFAFNIRSAYSSFSSVH